jgi:hypothetical protein
MIFLVLVLGASTLAITGPARDNHVSAGAAKRLTPNNAIFKVGEGVECVQELLDGSWQATGAGEIEPPCIFNVPSGVLLKIWEGEVNTTKTVGKITRGMIRVYTSGLPYRLIGDTRHLVEPNATIDVVIEDDLTHILSKEGETSVIACSEAEDSTCVKRGFFLLEGDRITLQRDGQVYAWENSEGDDLTMTDNGGCNVGVGKSTQSKPWLMVLILTLLWLKRRERRTYSDR